MPIEKARLPQPGGAESLRDWWAASDDSPLCAAVLVDELCALGVREAVLCPGSRSAPLAYALYAADQEGRLRLHVRIDERSAGFLALGLAKASGEAVPVVTTSGTAVANLLPALLEARHAGVPVLAVTADRPATLVGSGANQTTDQVGIFGMVPRASARIFAGASAPDAWRGAVRRVVIAARGTLSRLPGPAHINVELVEPLLGGLGELPAGSSFSVEAPAEPWPVALDPGPRTVVVAGDLPPAAGARLAAEAARAGVPLLAEPSSNARQGEAAIAAYRLLLPGFALGIERVVLVGHPTLSRPVSALLARRDIELVAVASSAEWVDPGWAVSRLLTSVVLPIGDAGWLQRWRRADAEVSRGLAGALGGDWTGPGIAAAVMGVLRETDVLVLGSSNPVRDADLAPVLSRVPRVFANRGLAGIDGTIATASGIGLVTGSPTTLLLGDLTTLHDVGSLLVPQGEPRPDLRVIVVDDGGGSIFAGLEYGAPAAEIGDRAEAFERLFGTPHGVDIAAIAAGFGHPVTRVSDAAGLRAAISSPPHGIEVVIATVGRTDRRAMGARLARLGTGAAQA